MHNRFDLYALLRTTALLFFSFPTYSILVATASIHESAITTRIPRLQSLAHEKSQKRTTFNLRYRTSGSSSSNV